LKYQPLRSTTVLLLGRVSDDSKVWSLSVNGVDMNICPQKNFEMYYPIKLEEKRPGEKETFTVTARDIYNNTASRDMVLYWGKTIIAYVKKIDGKDILLNKGMFDGVQKGMGFTVYGVDTFKDPLSGVPIYTTTEIGAVIVTTVYNDTSIATFIKPEQASKVKKGDIVK